MQVINIKLHFLMTDDWKMLRKKDACINEKEFE